MICNLFKTSHMLCVNIRTSMCVNVWLHVWVCMWITTLYISLSLHLLVVAVNLALYSSVEMGVCCECKWVSLWVCVIILNFCIYS